MNKHARWLALMAMVCAMFAGGCTPVVRNRTLPVSIRSVYIPMIRNTTQMPGLEERFTVAFQEEVLADGRLDIVSKREADAIVDIEVSQFGNSPIILNPDHFAMAKLYKVDATMNIVQNIPGRPVIGGPRDIEAEYSYNDDQRSVAFNPEPYEIEQLARVFARECLLELLTGEFDEDKQSLLEVGRQTGQKKDDDDSSGVKLPN